MAVMIPSQISPEIKSNAERYIYRWFEQAPGTDDWIVLHSLGISNHNCVIHGEVDFFVLVPDLGIFAIEVKGGRVKREKGIWYFTDKYDHTDSKVRGPFDQAWDGIYSIRKSLHNKLDESHSYLNQLFFGIGVMFPDVTYSSVGIDEEQWQVFDCSDGNKVKEFIERIAKGSITSWEKQFGTVKRKNRPSVEDVKYLAGLLRGDFDRIPSLRVQYNYTEDNLISLTDNQYRCIDQLEDNPRCLISGAAGTGKTLLAIEEAKKAVALGEQVILLCYNSLLGAWLKERFSELPMALRPRYVGTIHGYMLQLVNEQEMQLNIPSDSNDLPFFFEETLPSAAIKAAQNISSHLDRIIVDETQDIMSEKYVCFLDTCLKRGLARGKWAFFGDFFKQAIYEKTMSFEDFCNKLEDCTAFIRYKLKINCRNSKNICEEIKTVSKINNDTQYYGIANGPQVEYLTYNSQEDEREKLVDLIAGLRKDSVEPGRITILSPRVRADSVVSLLNEITVLNYSIPAPEEITFSTIHGFKGMENTVVILTDIESFKDEKLMYVAFSRARTGLYVLETEKASQEYAELFIRRIFTNE